MRAQKAPSSNKFVPIILGGEGFASRNWKNIYKRFTIWTRN